MIRLASALALVLAVTAPAAAQAPAPPALVRTVVNRADIPAGEAIQGHTTVPAGVGSGRHVHHGVEIVYVIDGVLEFKVDGQETRILKGGDMIMVRREVPHDVKSLGPGTAHLANSWIVDKDRPLAEPVP